MLVSDEKRTCRKCGVEKSLADDFYVVRGTPEWTCKACKVAHAVAWRNANYERYRAVLHRSQSKKRLGITDEQYDAAWSGRCEACGSEYKLCLDHNHTTGAVRGTLCHFCNLCVGWVRDDPERLLALIAYLERYAVVEDETA